MCRSDAIERVSHKLLAHHCPIQVRNQDESAARGSRSLVQRKLDKES